MLPLLSDNLVLIEVLIEPLRISHNHQHGAQSNVRPHKSPIYGNHMHSYIIHNNAKSVITPSPHY